jgi:hypothetical protein
MVEDLRHMLFRAQAAVRSLGVRARRLTPVLVARLAILLLAIALANLLRPLAPLRVEERRIGTTPARIYGGAAEGPAVVIAHGFAGSQQLMEPFAATLARAGYTAITFDFPGHGRNAPPDGTAMRTDRRSDQLERRRRRPRRAAGPFDGRGRCHALRHDSRRCRCDGRDFVVRD